MRNAVVFKIFLYELCENAWFPWQPLISFSRMRGRPTNSILSTVLLKLVSNESLDMCLSSCGQLCNHIICIFININEIL